MVVLMVLRLGGEGVKLRPQNDAQLFSANS
jgi:hypothetical protein